VFETTIGMTKAIKRSLLHVELQFRLSCIKLLLDIKCFLDIRRLVDIESCEVDPK